MKLLLNPVADGAFFANTLDVATATLQMRFPGVGVAVETRGPLTLLDVDVPEDQAPALIRLPMVQAIFRDRTDGALDPLDIVPDFVHPQTLVTGAKYRGKTHDLVTQLGIELGLCHVDGQVRRVLDPMAGRGTTLLWAARYGWDAVGVELDAQAPDHLHRHIKRQAKIYRMKHQYTHGWVGPKRSDGTGRFVDYALRPGRVRLITGDSRRLRKLVGPQPFDLLVTDLPYGVEFKGPRKEATNLLRECAPAWCRAVRPGGAMVVIFNRLLTRRDAVASAFEPHGARVVGVEVPHRMSESIDRDLLVIRRPLEI